MERGVGEDVSEEEEKYAGEDGSQNVFMKE
jgi:hypothetical protein